jgi:hypothetical protein
MRTAIYRLLQSLLQVRLERNRARAQLHLLVLPDSRNPRDIELRRRRLQSFCVVRGLVRKSTNLPSPPAIQKRKKNGVFMTVTQTLRHSQSLKTNRRLRRLKSGPRRKRSQSREQDVRMFQKTRITTIQSS